ncbi:MAG: tRNA lysidine(34) synthetase TilS, partial [Nitrospira sp.]|nr:tRNA lysidine(34) synthetase TilS [Nitrospira sp.]
MAVESTIMRPLSRPTARPALLTPFIRTVRQHQLFIPGQHLLVSVSGGPDSIALLSLLYHLKQFWRLRLTVVHCNYGLRGAESTGDESFVRDFCQERQLPLIIHRPVLMKKRQRSSIQALARDARYDFMRQLALEVDADRIAVGHTANDQAETVLMWLLRGAGLTGLAGMSYAREDRIIRPLLACTRDEVLAYLADEGLAYRRDSSNEKPLYHRNRIRQELLPIIMRLAPAAVGVLQRQADMLREDEQYLEQVTGEVISLLVSQDSGGLQRIDRQGFLQLSVAIQRRLIRNIIRACDEEGRASGFRVVESVRHMIISGKRRVCPLLKHVFVTVEPESVLVGPAGADCRNEIGERLEKSEGVLLPVPSTVSWARTNQQIHVQRMARREAEQR